MSQKQQPPLSHTVPSPEDVDGGLGFLGNHPVSLDSKLRLTVPARFKAILQEKYAGGDRGALKVIVTISLDETRNAAVYPLSEWNRFLGQFQRLPALERQGKTLQRLLTSLASLVELDAQGRIRLDKTIVDLTELDKRVVVVGCEDHFEIWNEERFGEFIKKALGHMDSLADSVLKELKEITAAGGAGAVPPRP